MIEMSGRDWIVVVEIDVGGGTCKYSYVHSIRKLRKCFKKKVKEVLSVWGIKWIEIVYLAFMVKEVLPPF